MRETEEWGKVRGLEKKAAMKTEKRERDDYFRK
jgi:hypothetical protein